MDSATAPKGGLTGGEVIVDGTPETVAAHERSRTGRDLALPRRGAGDGAGAVA